MNRLGRTSIAQLIDIYNEIGKLHEKELYAFYINDFHLAKDKKIKEMLFYYDGSENCFVLPVDNNIKYNPLTILTDDDFILLEKID